MLDNIGYYRIISLHNLRIHMKLFAVVIKISFLILMTLLVFSTCNLKPSSPPQTQPTPRQISLDEAIQVLDNNLPIPFYLPDNLELTAVYLMAQGTSAFRFNLVFYPQGSNVSGNIDNAIDEAPIWMSEQFFPGGFGYLPPVSPTTEIFDISGVGGYLNTGNDSYNLFWQSNNWTLNLYSNLTFPKEDLVKIARSVKIP